MSEKLRREHRLPAARRAAYDRRSSAGEATHHKFIEGLDTASDPVQSWVGSSVAAIHVIELSIPRN